jgi:hypothetical protein
LRFGHVSSVGPGPVKYRYSQGCRLDEAAGRRMLCRRADHGTT